MEDHYVKKAIDSGMDFFISKPINFQELSQVMDAQLQSWSNLSK